MAQDNNHIASEFEKIKNEAIFTLSRLVNLYGLTFSESRLFSFMFLENNPMTLDEMSHSLGMSKTSMSTGVRSLLDTQMVERTWKKGIRKDLYMAEEDLYKIFSNAFIEQWSSSIEHNTKSLNEISRELTVLSTKLDDPDLQAPISEYSKKIEDVINFYKWLSDTFDEIQNKIDNLQK